MSAPKPRPNLVDKIVIASFYLVGLAFFIYSARHGNRFTAHWSGIVAPGIVFTGAAYFCWFEMMRTRPDR